LNDFVLPLTVLILAHVLLRGLLAKAAAWLPQDLPNERSMHTVPTPRFGGLAILLGIAAGLVVMSAGMGWWLPLILLAAVSLFDDYRPLPAVPRLLAQLLAAGLFLGLAGSAPTPAWLAGLLALLLIWMTNLYNFMDGLDGLAGGMAVFGFGAYALAAGLAGANDLMLLALCVTAAAAAFLRFNFPPARLFMGDAGAIPLGFLAAALGIEGWLRGLWSPLFPLLAFSPFILDASVTLLRRMAAGKRLWQAHREHYYQRLARLGWPVRRILLGAYAIMFASGLTACLAERHPTGPAILAGLAAAYLVLFGWIDRRWRLSGEKT